jgi:quinol-cytochrome oxidoreductase complex cytochrome b subunit
VLEKIYHFLDKRLHLTPLVRHALDEPIPGGASWIYVFGSVVLFTFGLQLVTGMFLILYYVPTPDHAYDSIQFIETGVAFGSFIRGLHHWGASVMIVAIGLHMLQTFLYGAYRPPREVLWNVGVVLFILVLTFAFTGYLLPWDQKAYWATSVGINMVGTIPLIGGYLVRILRGGEDVGALTLSRFFAVHILFLPWLTAALIGLHIFILRRVGPAGPWDKERQKVHREPFFPRQVFMDAVAMFFTFCLVSAMAIWLPFPLADKANPADTSFVPVPEWYFLFYYQLLKYFEGPFQPIATIVLPLLFFALLFLLPYIEPGRDRDPSRRPTLMVTGGIFMILVFFLLGISIGQISAVAVKNPPVASGKDIYQRLQCSGCHRIGGEGAAVGPDLSYEGDKRDADWLIRHFKDPQAVSPGSFMPKFDLSQHELNDLTAYMLSLKKSG